MFVLKRAGIQEILRSHDPGLPHQRGVMADHAILCLQHPTLYLTNLSSFTEDQLSIRNGGKEYAVTEYGTFKELNCENNTCFAHIFLYL